MIYDKNKPNFNTVQKVALKVHQLLTEHNIPHLLCGGLAVFHHGYHRTTDDVDFLVDHRAFTHHPSGLVSLKVPAIEMDGVKIDFVSIKILENFITNIIDSHITTTDQIPTINKETLILLKLHANRFRDRADVIELLKRGLLEVNQITNYLKDKDPILTERWNELNDVAASEED